MNGIIIINKPKGCTSHDIVYKAKRIFNEKVGHTGTLDPNATGVLPLLIGKGTEISKYLINHDKTYEAILQLGEKKDTADSEGKTIEEQNVTSEMLSEVNVKKVLQSFEGHQEQIPPMYSAIKVNGKKLYEYARKGQTVELKPRKIEIYKMELLNIDIQNKTIEFRVDCSKGTYIRALCENIAERIGTVGYMKELKRTRVGEFKIEDAITIQELEDSKNKLEKFITLEKFFENSKNILLDDMQKVNATMGDDEGLVEIERDIEGVEVGILLKEKEGANGYKVSMRSKEELNVSDVCLLLGG